MKPNYKELPKYANLTEAQARYRYLHELLAAYQRLSPEDIQSMRGCQRKTVERDCRYCSFSGFLGGDPAVCCNWRAESDPDRAIYILETLLSRECLTRLENVRGVKKGSEFNIQLRIGSLAKHYGKESQMAIAQEEAAELIQAISKVRRHGETENTLDHLAEEIADVQIMCRQLAWLYGLRREVQEYMDAKVERQEIRIKEEGECQCGKT